MEQQETKVDKKKLAANLEFERKRMRKPVTGIFNYHEVQGGCISFNYKEFKGDPIEKYTMSDGVTYTVPMGVARHLNRSGSYPRYGYVKIDSEIANASPRDGDNLEQRVVQKVRRYSFSPLSFVDIDEMPSVD